MRSLNKRIDDIKPFNERQFKTFCEYIKARHVAQVRFGIYGEAAFLSLDVLEALSELGPHRGYTHQWMHLSSEYAKYFMASTHSAVEVFAANLDGWRAYNVGKVTEAINCPASKEAGRKSTCSTCGLCNGMPGKSKKNIYIVKH